MICLFRLGLAVLSALLLAPSTGQAQVSSTSGTASTVVDNSFTAVEFVAADIDQVAIVVAPLTIGTATYVLNPDGSTVITNSGTDARFIPVDQSGKSPGQINISGAAPSTPLSLSFSTLSNLTCGACMGGNPVIVMDTYTSDVGFNPSTDASGNLTINFGFTLTTQAGAAYEDGTYTGQYQVMISY
jgi:hypothetical protein